MADLLVDRLMADPDVVEGKRRIEAAMERHAGQLTGIVQPDPDRAVSYAEMIEEFGRLRGGGLFYPYVGSGFGRGPFVELADGSVKYDFISGIGVHHLGRAHRAVVGAALRAALKDTIMQGNLQQNVESLDLARDLVAAANRTGGTFAHCFLTSSGAMANENALKLIFQKNHPADRLLAFEGCFMGRTLVLSQLTDKPDYRIGLPQTIAVDYLPFFDADDPVGSTREAQRRLDTYLSRYPGRYAALCCELVLGEGGFYPGCREFFEPLMKKAAEEGIAVMADEIQTFGRTEELFAFQMLGLEPYMDVVTVGKLSQVCATLFRAEFKPKPGLLSQTFTASTAAILGGRAILNELLGGGYFGPEGKIRRIHEHTVGHLRDLSQRHPDVVSGPFGSGVMIAFTALGGDLDRVKRFLQRLFENGVIAFYAGKEPARVRFLIPVGAVDEAIVDDVMAIVTDTLMQVANEP